MMASTEAPLSPRVSDDGKDDARFQFTDSMEESNVSHDYARFQFTDSMEQSNDTGIREPVEINRCVSSCSNTPMDERVRGSYRSTKDKDHELYENLYYELLKLNEEIEKLDCPPDDMVEKKCRLQRRLNVLQSQLRQRDTRKQHKKRTHPYIPDEERENELWKSKVAESLPKDYCVQLAMVFNVEQSLIMDSQCPGLDLIEEIERKDCQGDNWNRFKEALCKMEYVKVANVFDKYYQGPSSATVNSKPWNFNDMISDLKGMLDVSDARHLATYAKLTNHEKYITKIEGAPYLLDLLLEKGYFMVDKVKSLRQMLTNIDRIKAANRVKVYEDHLTLPTFNVTLNYSSVENYRHFDNVATEITNETERISKPDRPTNLNHHLQNTYDTPLKDLNKGSIILTLCVKKTESLQRLISDIQTGEFAKQCSKILFPKEENMLCGKDDELRLEVTYNDEELVMVYEELKRMAMKESGKYETMAPSDFMCPLTIDITPSIEHNAEFLLSKQNIENTNGHEFVDVPNEKCIIISLGVKSKESLIQLLEDIDSGEFNSKCSEILFPSVDCLKVRASYDQAQCELDLEKLGYGENTWPSHQNERDRHPTTMDTFYSWTPNANVELDLLPYKATLVFSDTYKQIQNFEHYSEAIVFPMFMLDKGINKSHILETSLDFPTYVFAISMLTYLIAFDDTGSWMKLIQFIMTFSPMCTSPFPCLLMDPVDKKKDYIDGLSEDQCGCGVQYIGIDGDGGQDTHSSHSSVSSSSRTFDDISHISKDLKKASTRASKVITQSVQTYVKETKEEGTEDRSYYENIWSEAATNKCILHHIFWVPSIDDRGYSRLYIEDDMKTLLTSSFIDLYPNHGVNRVPPLPQIHYKIKTRNVYSDCEKQSTISFPISDKQLKESRLLSGKQKESILQNRNANRHVTKIADMIYHWATDMQLKMFILTNYKYQNYLTDVRCSVTMHNGEYDIVVIGIEVGVIFIEVSSCRGNSEKVIKQHVLKTHSKLMKNKFVFLESNRDLIHFVSKVPMYQFSVFPNISQNVLNKYVCMNHSNSIINKECYENDDISNWLNERVIISSVPCLSVEHYQYLCIRYVGETSKIKVRTIKDGICDTAKKLGNSFLTPEQRSVVKHSRSYQVLAGDYGTGKSLCLFVEARHLLKQNNENKVCHIICSEIEPEVFTSTTNENNGQLTSKTNFIKFQRSECPSRVTTFVFQRVSSTKLATSNLIATLKNIVLPQVHVFLHEVPLAYIEETENLLTHFKQSIPDTTLWISVATHSLRDMEVLKENCKTSIFHFDHFTYHMKMTERVINLYKALQEFVGDSFDDITETGHVIEGPEPIVHFLDVCRCPLNVINFDRNTLSCECIKNRLFKVLEEAWKTLKGISANKIAFYIHCHLKDGQIFNYIYKLLSRVTSAMGLSIKWWQEMTSQQEDCIVVVNEFRILTEGKYVVVSIDPFGMNQWKPKINRRDPHIPILSKCLSQYVHVSWPTNEATRLHDIELNNWEECVSKMVQRNDDKGNHNANMKILSHIERLRQSKGDCLNHLLSLGFISVR